MVTVLAIVGVLALIGSALPLAILFINFNMFREYWPTTDVNNLWIGLLVGLVFLALARVLAEVQDIRAVLNEIKHDRTAKD